MQSFLHKFHELPELVRANYELSHVSRSNHLAKSKLFFFFLTSIIGSFINVTSMMEVSRLPVLLTKVKRTTSSLPSYDL